MKGMRWIATSGSKFVMGRYEPEKTQAIIENVKDGDVVYDIGAHVGYFTILMSRIVGDKDHIYSFEPRPITHHFLKTHVRINHRSNITITNACVGDKAGTVTFETRTGTGASHMS